MVCIVNIYKKKIEKNSIYFFLINLFMLPKFGSGFNIAKLSLRTAYIVYTFKLSYYDYTCGGKSFQPTLLYYEYSPPWFCHSHLFQVFHNLPSILFDLKVATLVGVHLVMTTSLIKEKNINTISIDLPLI